MRSITIRLPDAEAAMLVVAQRKNPGFRNLETMLIKLIRDEYFSLVSGHSGEKH